MTSSKPPVEWFRPTSGSVVGWLGIATAVALLAFSLGVGTDTGAAPAGVAGAFLLALGAWVAMLRPRLGVSEDEVVMRGMLSTTYLPLAGVENVTVRQVLALWVGGKRYISAAIGHSYLKVARARRHPHGEPAQLSKDLLYPDHVADSIDHRSKLAMHDAGLKPHTEAQAALAAQVRRTWAWPEIAGLVVLTAALVWLLVL
ncbi:hypothetical protein [Nocardioides insulae]|uniref:hypothetical protein n=1 Tax=Nocardioides insulae TaxID=394734 RepID=UPI0004176306|nr:hypothetical protein [Nocardioides insulae]